MTRTLGVALAILAAGYPAAGCASGGVKSALPSVSASGSISSHPPRSRLPTVSPPTVPSRTRSPSDSAAPPSETASAEPPTPTTEPSSPPTHPPGHSPPGPRPPRLRLPRRRRPPRPWGPRQRPRRPPSRPHRLRSRPRQPLREASPSPAASESGSTLLWLWILLVPPSSPAWPCGSPGARASGRPWLPSWRSKVADASANGLALKDMMTTAETQGAQAAEDASARWAGIERRADDLAETLYGLRETAPSEAERAYVADVLASLQAVRSAMDAERAPGGAGRSKTHECTTCCWPLKHPFAHATSTGVDDHVEGKSDHGMRERSASPRPRVSRGHGGSSAPR